MSGLRRTWVVPVAVADAWTLLPTPGTSDEPQDPPPPDMQDPGWGWGEPAGGPGAHGECQYRVQPAVQCNGRNGLHLYCPYVIILLGCL